MKSIQIKVNGLTYTVKSTTEEGLKQAVRSLKKSLKKNKEEDGI
tara:strand:+ start:1727 stop:1858 length:132 start_codon:yes stop_codon:yes gene_type:complete